MSKEEFLPFSRPNISAEAIAEVSACLESGWITTGPRTKKFEDMLQAYLQASSVQACSSATAGLLMALVALDLQDGDEVITTAMTFVATLNTIVLAGGKPCIVDIDRKTYNLDLEQLEAAITPRTRAIIPVHFAGLVVDLDRLYAIAEKHGLRVIEDAAHAIGAEYKSKRIGSFGDMQVFSFHPNKNMTTGEGGCVASRDEDIQKRIHGLRFHGIDREAWARFGKSGTPQYDVVLAGYKFNFMDMQAAIGMHQLPRLDGFNQKRKQLADRYFQLFASIEGLILPDLSGLDYDYKHVWHLFAPLVDIDKVGLSRDDFMARLKEHNIGTGLHYQAPHLTTYYEEKWGFKRGMFPNAEFVSDRIVSLPLFPTLSESEQDCVVSAVENVLGVGNS